MELKKIDLYIGNVMYKNRINKHLSQPMLSKLISNQLIASGKRNNEISRQRYATYERGEISMPEDVYEAACNILGIDKNELFNQAVEQLKR